MSHPAARRRSPAARARRAGQSLLVAVSALAAAAAPAHAQYFGRNKVQYEKFDFKVLKTPHFDLHYYPQEEEFARDAAREAERWYARHSETLRHTFDRRPLVVYANIPDFLQTNVTEIGDEGTGGVTTGARERVAYRFTGIPADDDHVLGHELVHVFQYDLALRGMRDTTARGGGNRGLASLDGLPLWLIEGMAEYLSVGRDDPLTAMWLRDAVLRNRLPTIKQLTTDPRFFPYRYGQALWAYIGGSFGDERVREIYATSLRLGYEGAFKRVLGMSTDSLSKRWIAQIKADYQPLVAGRTKPTDAGLRVLAAPVRDGQYNIGPALSPDGKYVALFSSKDVFGIDLFLADATTGKIVRKLTDVTSDQHLDAVSFLYSSGTFSPDASEFAYVVYSRGDNELRVVNTRTGKQRTVRPKGIDAMTTLAWSPDGKSLAIAGQHGAVSDLFLYDLAGGSVRNLTNDNFADLQPAWSPDGKSIAFTSDRPGSDFDRLSFQPMKLSIMDVATGTVRTLNPVAAQSTSGVAPAAETQAFNPQFSPDGKSVYFVSDPGGFADVYRTDLTSGALYQVTRLATAVSGVANLSPALTVSRQTGRVMFSVFERQGFQVYGLDSARAAGTLAAPAQQLAAQAANGGSLPPVRSAGQGTVAAYLRDVNTGLPPRDSAFASRDYSPRLQIEAIGQPTIGVGQSTGFGTLVGGSTAAYFTDLLGNRNLGVGLQANGTLKDIGAQVQYFNVGSRLQWGIGGGRTPYLTGYAGYLGDGNGNITGYQQILQRIYIDQIAGTLQYPLSTTRRFEVNPGITRYSYDTEIYDYSSGGVSRQSGSQYDLPTVNVGQLGFAFVGDNSFSAFTGPVAGQRFRFEVSPTFGTLRYATALADYRRYFFLRPATLAFRGTHYGRYGKDEQDPLLYPFYLGQGTLVRGYEYNSVVDECYRTPTASGGCPTFDRLWGSRLAFASAELRIPLLGTEQFGLIRSNILPLEVAPFVDAGMAWSAGDPVKFTFNRTSADRIPVVSTGLTMRTNLFGFAVLEAYYAYPFQRTGEGAHFGFNLAPGW